jgi:hypothetical protein
MRADTPAVAMTAALATVLAAYTSGRPALPSRATTLEASRSVSRASTIPAADSAAFPDQVTVTVTSLTPAGDDLGAWLSTEVRIDNHSDHSQHLPAIGIRCAANPTVGEAPGRHLDAVPGGQPSRPLHPPRKTVAALARRPAPGTRCSPLSGTRGHPGL